MNALRQTETTIAVSDIQMHVRIRGTGEPLLLLHGFTGSGADWVHMFDLDDLARRYTLIMPDLRGHGRSTGSGRFTHRQCGLDVIELLDRLGMSRCKALGTSAGGNTLLHVSTREPQRVEAMVLFGAPSYFPVPARAIMRTMTKRGAARTSGESCERHITMATTRSARCGPRRAALPTATTTCASPRRFWPPSLRRR